MPECIDTFNLPKVSLILSVWFPKIQQSHYLRAHFDFFFPFGGACSQTPLAFVGSQFYASYSVSIPSRHNFTPYHL